MEAVLSWHHLLTVPERLQDTTNPMPRSILLQFYEQVVPFYSVIGLPKVQEYQEERVLVYAANLLGEL